MIKFYVNSQGEYYHGDRMQGDREANEQELVALTESRRRLAASAQIRALEFEQLLPRAVREFLLGYMEERATPEQLALLPAYVKLKTFDNTIAGLRAIVRGEA